MKNLELNTDGFLHKPVYYGPGSNNFVDLRREKKSFQNQQYIVPWQMSVKRNTEFVMK